MSFPELAAILGPEHYLYARVESSDKDKTLHWDVLFVQGNHNAMDQFIECWKCHHDGMFFEYKTMEHDANNMEWTFWDNTGYDSLLINLNSKKKWVRIVPFGNCTLPQFKALLDSFCRAMDDVSGLSARRSQAFAAAFATGKPVDWSGIPTSSSWTLFTERQ